jgi:hypothetical protein
MSLSLSGSEYTPPHLLQIMIGNTSTMDYSLPLLLAIKHRYPKVIISVLYCVYDRRSILRKSKYYSDILKEAGINEYDFIDFIRIEFKFLKLFLRKIYSNSSYDIKSSFNNTISSKTKISYSWQKKNIKNKLRHLKAWLIVYVLRINMILKTLKPDLILFDNRSDTKFHGRNSFYSYFDQKKIPIVLLPHGPHYRTPDAFCPFDEFGDIFPSYCDDWSPFKYATPWTNFPDKQGQFVEIGYPSFDNDWNKQLINRNNDDVSERSLKCVFILRGFFPKGFKRPEEFDPFTVDYDDIFPHIRCVGKAIRETGRNIEVIVKPHPSSNYELVAEVMGDSGLTNWRISQEPFFDLVPNIDFVISYCSTSLLLTIAAKIPTIILDSKIQRYFNENWNRVEQLYTGFQLYLKDNKNLVKYIGRVLTKIDTNESDNFTSKDLNHLRQFFSDGAIERGIKRIDQLLQNQ